MDWINGGSRIEVNSFDDIALQPPGKAVLIGCPSSTFQGNMCIQKPNGIAYTNPGYVRIGRTDVSQIFLCSRFFRAGFLTRNNNFANQCKYN